MNEPMLDSGRSAWLDLRLDVLRRGLREQEPPGEMERVLAERFRARHRLRRKLAWVPALALAATIVLTAWIVRPVQQSALQHSSRSMAQDNDGPFLALRPLDTIALEPGATVVPVQFPRALLAEWGLPVAPDRAAEPVHAEMLVSANGEPLAVRLIR